MAGPRGRHRIAPLVPRYATWVAPDDRNVFAAAAARSCSWAIVNLLPLPSDTATRSGCEVLAISKSRPKSIVATVIESCRLSRIWFSDVDGPAENVVRVMKRAKSLPSSD
jgi:hypothetical protein